MIESQKVFLNALNSIPGVGVGTLKLIGENLNGDFEAGFGVSESQLKTFGLRPQEITALIEGRKKTDPEKEWLKMQRHGVKMIVSDEPEFPRLLKVIPSSPLFFYLRGELKKEDDFCFGIVGTRLATNYGKETAFDVGFKIAQAGLTVASGMAVGIDAEAHKGALGGGGRTIAVVASGLDEKSLFPQENMGLSRKITEHGALISEYSVGMNADRNKFVARNRLISGLSKGVLVVEAPLRSGALITARYAIEQNRDVFAVPGNISSRMSFGTNLLIKQGAALVARAEDIFQELNIKYAIEAAPGVNFKPASGIEEKVFGILNENGEPRHIDEIARTAGFGVQKISSALTAMEMKGIIKNLGSGQFALHEKYLSPEESEEE